MAQYRWWNYRDDDSTFQMNQRDLVLLPFGLYCGFDGVLAAGMTLTLNHLTTGKTKMDLAGSPSSPLGIWKTKQGCVVQEDAAVTVAIPVGDATHPRIDLIVGEHDYVVSLGGATALYKVIVGTPSATPVAPSAADNQTILGVLYIPATTTNLNGTGVTYTRENIPNFAGDESVAHLEREQEFTAEQIMSLVTAEWGVCYLNAASNLIDLTKDSSGVALTGATLAENLKKNKFVINQIIVGVTDVTNITPYPSSLAIEAKEREFFTLSVLNLQASSNFLLLDVSKDLLIRQFEVFKVISVQDTIGTSTLTGRYAVSRGGAVMLNTPNALLRTLSTAKVTGAFSGTKLTHGTNGNYIEIVTGSGTETIETIEEVGVGTIIVVKGTGVPLILVHNTGTAKPLFLPNGVNITSLSENEVFFFVEDTTHWRLIDRYNDLIDPWNEVTGATIAASLIVSGMSGVNANSRFRWKIVGKTLYFHCIIITVGGGGSVSTTNVLRFPSGVILKSGVTFPTILGSDTFDIHNVVDSVTFTAGSPSTFTITRGTADTAICTLCFQAVLELN